MGRIKMKSHATLYTQKKRNKDPQNIMVRRAQTEETRHHQTIR